MTKMLSMPPLLEDDLHLIGRSAPLFTEDLKQLDRHLTDALNGARVLVLGGAGSIGRHVVKQVFSRAPAALHVVDISENNLVELVRDLRSSHGYIEGETRFLPIDMGGREFKVFTRSEKGYDYVFNLAAMKHVRSEKDAFSLMRMIQTNVIHTKTTFEATAGPSLKKYFAVSTDKAKRPANLMGATKRIMERLLDRLAENSPVSTARFANVAFSDGSLLQGFHERIKKMQPLSAPSNICRYFMTGVESGILCLSSAIFGENRHIFFPKLEAEMHLITFADIAARFLEAQGFEPVFIDSEEEARTSVHGLAEQKKWPCYVFESDTSGEKPFEEFYTDEDALIMNRYRGIGIIEGFGEEPGACSVAGFLRDIDALYRSPAWNKNDIVDLIKECCPSLSHIERHKNLDQVM